MPEELIGHHVHALAEDYRRISAQILEHTKLQYQLVSVAVAIAAAASAFWGSLDTPPDPSAILFFPPLFCAIALVQLYLHATIKSSARYINFKLRPYLQAALAAQSSAALNSVDLWSWEEYYVASHRLARFLIRQLGSFIILLPWLFGLACLVVYQIITSSPRVSVIAPWITANWVLVLLTLLIFAYIKYINERWWATEQDRLDRASAQASEDDVQAIAGGDAA